MSKWLVEFRRGWQGISDPPLPLNAGFAVLCLLGGTGLRWIVALFRPDSPFSLYLPAVVLASVFGGSRLGAVTLFAGGLLGFLLSFSGGAPAGAGVLALLAIYLIIGFLVIWGVTHYRSLLARQREFSGRLMQEEAYRKLVVDELQHRLKNKISTILAVIRQTLDEPEAVAKLEGRIRALSATDDHISKADEKGCDIRELLLPELGPYGHVRFLLNGEAVYLPAKLAVSLALVFHELATNAAKHGAFSSPVGMLQVSWTVDQAILRIVWDEAEGPFVTAPDHTGFGTRLLNFALLPFGGTSDLQFLPTGIRCTLSCKIPTAEVR
jgi:two-component sensor histidine kinase